MREEFRKKFAGRGILTKFPKGHCERASDELLAPTPSKRTKKEFLICAPRANNAGKQTKVRRRVRLNFWMLRVI